LVLRLRGRARPRRPVWCGFGDARLNHTSGSGSRPARGSHVYLDLGERISGLGAALLHDAFEDHVADIAPGGGWQEALAVLAGRFGARTAALVAAVTNPEWEPGRDEHEQYREHVLASLEASPWARVIKASDFTDNAVGSSTPPAQAGQAVWQVRPAGASVARAYPEPGHPAGHRRQGHDRRSARRRPGAGLAAIRHGRDGDSQTSQSSATQSGSA
jgi:hypothetical protein